MPRISVLLLTALAPLAVAGCFPNPDYRQLPTESVIGRRTETLAALALSDLKAPAEAEKAAVAAQLAAAGDTGVRVRVQLARSLAQAPELDLRRHLSDLGVPPGIAILERASGVEQTRLVFERTTLAAPDCSQMVTNNESWTFATETYAAPRPAMAFGCATYTNLSRQIADPADLTAPRALAPPDAPTTADAIQRFHDNKATPLRKTTSTEASYSQ